MRNLLKNQLFKLLDAVFAFGVKTCPQCFSRQMVTVSMNAAHPHPMKYCNGCNTLWPERQK